jgi:integrase
MPNKPRLIAFRGKTLPLERHAEAAKIPAATVRSRIDNLGWSVADALSVPADRRFASGGRPRANMPRPCPPVKQTVDGRARVRWSVAGRQFCRHLGQWGSPEAQEGYRRFQAEWAQGLANAKSLPGALLVSELADAYTDHAVIYYRKDGRLTSEFHLIRSACLAMIELCGSKAVATVDADDIRNLQAHLTGRGLTRGTVNAYVSRVVRMFGWGAGHKGNSGAALVPAAVLGMVQNVPALQAGRSRAIDRPAVSPVPWADVKATLPHLHKNPKRRAVLEAAVRVHWFTGMRSTELLSMRPADLDRSKKEWKYTVPRWADKELHRRGKPLVYWIGPKAKAELTKLLRDCPADRPVFSLPPRHEGGRWRPLTRDAYRRFIALACRAAGVKHWHPHRIRHSRATEVERIYESDAAAAAAIGDSPEVARRVYVDPNEAVHRRIARETG